MKYLVSFKIFENSYNKEEYYDFITKYLSKYNISPVQVRELLDKKAEDIERRINSGESPQVFANQLKDEMDLQVDRGAMSVRFNQPIRNDIKYL